MTSITFTVFGAAIPKGSTKSFAYALKNRTTGAPVLDRHGKPIYRASTTHDNPKTKGWQQLVAEAASHAMNGNGCFSGPSGCSWNSIYRARNRCRGRRWSR